MFVVFETICSCACTWAGYCCACHGHGTGSCDKGVVEDGDREAVEGGVVDDSMF